ncbi:MAG: hypothetical protein AAGA62_14370, partial [Bacteroidota bacterium]
MNNLILLSLLLFLFACDTEEDPITPSPENTAPVVQTTATYGVLADENIIYGEGLSHQSLNSPGATAVPLVLDVYVPNNDAENRPAFLFIHGGGFMNGSRRGGPVPNLANFY